MKPNFALSLSQDGISLLHRAAEGWESVGKATLTQDDLNEQLAEMRQTATTLEPNGLHTKVVIPDDQIKYLTLPIDPAFDRNVETVAREALDGTTPYSIDELVFATKVDGKTLQIAAVARETLQEAEVFATAHRFNPVCFAAASSNEQFAGEPIFGPTTLTGHESDYEEQSDKDASSNSLTSESIDVNVKSDETETDALVQDDDISFVSRRKVPTFRTESELAEASVDYKSGPGASAVPDPNSDRTSSNSLEGSIGGAKTPHAPVDTSLAGRRDSIIRVVAVILIVMLGIAGFASGAFNAGWNALFDGSSGKGPELRFAAPVQPNQPAAAKPAPASAPEPETDLPAAQTLSDEDTAVLEALALPDTSPESQDSAEAPVPADGAPDIKNLQAYYAVFGIWPKAPDVPRPAALVDLNDFYVPSIDIVNPQFDAVALPSLTSYQSDTAFLSPFSPAPAGTRFALDDKGMVIPTPGGALNADGISVVAGPPPLRQPDDLVRIETPGENLEQRIRLSGFRPVVRPDDLLERNERAAFGGQTRAELGQYRPKLRPQSAQESALAAASLVSLDGDGALIRQTMPEEPLSPENLAVAASLRPDSRPPNFSQIVARTQKSAQPKPVATAAVQVAPRSVTPSIPSSASTAREATQRNAINLRKVNLIGVYGTPSSRRALVRLGNGRYRKVEVGDRIDGGKVSAIGESELRYQKSGRAVVLRMPRS